MCSDLDIPNIILQVFIGEDGGCGSIREHTTTDGVVSIAAHIFALDLLNGSVHPAMSQCILLHLLVLQDEVRCVCR